MSDDWGGASNLTKYTRFCYTHFFINVCIRKKTKPKLTKTKTVDARELSDFRDLRGYAEQPFKITITKKQAYVCVCDNTVCVC